MVEVQTINLHGTYESHRGMKYKYYGKCSTWVPGEDCSWEIHLYRHDKKFTSDSTFDSPDMLAELSGPLLNISIDADTVLELARNAAENAIEEWDQDQQT